MKQQMDRNRKLDQERGQGKETIGELLLERSKHQTDLATLQVSTLISLEGLSDTYSFPRCCGTYIILQRQHSEVSAHCQQTEAKLVTTYQVTAVRNCCFTSKVPYTCAD